MPKKVKIAKYTKDKSDAAWAKWHEEKDKMTYTIPQNMKYILGEAWCNSRSLFAAMLVIVFAQTAENLCAVYVDKYIVDLALGTTSRVTLAVISFLLIFGSRFFRLIKNEGYKYKGYIGQVKFNSYLCKKLLKKNMTTDYENNERTAVNDSLQKAHTSASWVANSAVGNIQNTLISLLGILSFGGILSTISPVMTLIVGIPAIVGYKINRHKMLWVWNMADNWQTFERQLQYIQLAGSDFSCAKDVRLFGMERWFSKTFQRSFEKRLDWCEQQDAWERRWDMLAIVIQGIGNFAAYAYIMYLVINENIGAGSFVLYFNSIMKLSVSFRSWCDNYSAFQWLSNNINYMRQYFEMKDKTNRSEGKPLPTSDYEIEFKNVSYTYHGADKPTIDNITFTLHKGEKLALVGLNGAGKTTLIKLMCGLYDVTEGEILLNGTNIKEYNRDDYFSMFSVVFQDISKLPVSIAENVAAEIKEKIDNEKLYQCFKNAGIYDKIMSLPEKENTRLVKSVYENSTEFSGGQAQKLALAKALYKNAPILLLDEPTAALDAISEQEMYQHYADFSKGKASVFISHRLASTRFCDRIILIENGKCIEAGSHDELMKLCGKYSELFSLQSSYYSNKDGGENGE